MLFQEITKDYRGLPKSIYVIFFARIVNSMGNFVRPFLTIFLTLNLGLPKSQAGFFVMLASTAFAPGSLIGGKLADHIGRKKIFIIFQLLSAAAFVPCAFLGDSIIIPWLLIASGLFIGAAEPASTAMATDLTDHTNRKQAFSLLYLGHNIGFAVGPMIAGFLYRNYLPWIFIGDALTTVISISLVARFVSETIPDKETVGESNTEWDVDEKAEDCGLFLALLRRPALLIFSFIAMIYSFVYSQCSFSLPLQVNEIFDVNGPMFFGVLMSTNAVTVVLMTAIVTHRTVKFKPILCISMGGIFYAIGFGMIYFINHLYLLVVSTFIWTIGEILVVTNMNVYVANNAPISHRGRFNSVVQIIMGAGFAISPLLTGHYIEHASIRTVWMLSFFLASGATLLMVCLHMASKMVKRRMKQETAK